MGAADSEVDIDEAGRKHPGHRWKQAAGIRDIGGGESRGFPQCSILRGPPTRLSIAARARGVSRQFRWCIPLQAVLRNRGKEVRSRDVGRGPLRRPTGLGAHPFPCPAPPAFTYRVKNVSAGENRATGAGGVALLRNEAGCHRRPPRGCQANAARQWV